MKVLILSYENLDYVAQRTGESRKELRERLWLSKLAGKSIYISLGAPWSG